MQGKERRVACSWHFWRSKSLKDAIAYELGFKSDAGKEWNSREFSRFLQLTAGAIQAPQARCEPMEGAQSRRVSGVGGSFRSSSPS